MSLEQFCPVYRIKTTHGEWGGVLDCDGNFVEESKISTAFGGKYACSENEILEIPETVIYIPIIPKHWGHFLIDCVCRLWFVGDAEFDEYKIAYCVFSGQDGEIRGNYLQMLDLLGISKDRLLFVNKPIRLKRILIPSATFGFGINYSRDYIDIIDRAINNALKDKKIRELEPSDKIYFTRTMFQKSRFNEVGEREIEGLFRKNGFKIMAPERMTLVEQIFYINNCEIMASMSGTAAHNVIFGRKGIKQIIINRTCLPNPPQFRINQLFDVECIYIDAYTKWSEKHPRDYGDGPIWIEVNDNVKKFANDNNWQIEKVSTTTKIRNICFFSILLVLRNVKRNKILKKLIRKIKT